MTLITTLVFTILLGIGLTILLSKNKENFGISIFLAPIVSFSIISIVGMFYLNYNLKRETYQLILISLTIISLSFTTFWIAKKKLLQSISVGEIKIASLYGASFLTILFLIDYFLNPVRNNFLFHRLASDLPSYLISSQHLIDGGDLSNAYLHIFSNEIFNRALRWGFPAATSFIGTLTNNRAEYIIFYLPLIIYISGLFAAFLILVKSDSKLELKQHFLFMLPIAMTLNIGVVFFLFESFYPQIISISAITVIISIFFSLRKNYFPRQVKKYLLLNIAIISSSIILIYSEAYLILILAIGGVLFLDIIFKNKKHFKLDLLFLLTIIFSTILIFPFIAKFIAFTIANSSNIANIGFPLPGIPMPSDWVGITNIFSNSNLFLKKCGGPCIIEFQLILFQRIISIILSLWVLFEISKFFKNKDNNDRAFFLVPVVGILSFLIINVIFTETLKITNNYYLYNKTITLFLPIITYIFLSHLYKYEKNTRFLLAIIMCFISFVIFIADSKKNMAEIDLKIVNYFQENQDLTGKYLFTQNERGSRNSHVNPRLRYVDRAGEMILYSLVKGDFFDQWTPAHWKNIPKDSQNKEIVILTNIDYLAKNTLDSLQKNKILFQSGKYIAVLTGVKLKDISSLSEERRYAKLEELFLR